MPCLKVLEEPPAYCTIILLCTRLELLLPTIKSRCQVIRFGPVEEKRIVERLTATGLGSREAVFFARLAQGSLGLACQWARLEQDGVGLFATKRDLVAALADYKLADVPEIVERIQEAAKGIAAGWGNLDKATSKSDLGRRAQRTLIQILISALYDVAIHHVAAAAAAHQRRPGSGKLPLWPAVWGPSRPSRASATATRCSAGWTPTSMTG